MNNCFHCGTKLVPYAPAMFKDGIEVGREKTDNKWCSNCRWVVARVLQTLLGVES
jgi:hypothetical protein